MLIRLEVMVLQNTLNRSKAPQFLVTQKVEALSLKLVLFEHFFSIYLVGAKNAKNSTKLKKVKKHLNISKKNFKT